MLFLLAALLLGAASIAIQSADLSRCLRFWRRSFRHDAPAGYGGACGALHLRRERHLHLPRWRALLAEGRQPRAWRQVRSAPDRREPLFASGAAAISLENPAPTGGRLARTAPLCSRSSSLTNRRRLRSSTRSPLRSIAQCGMQPLCSMARKSSPQPARSAGKWTSKRRSACLRQVILTLTSGAEIPIVVRETQPPFRMWLKAGCQSARRALRPDPALFARDARRRPWPLAEQVLSSSAACCAFQRVENADGAARYTVSANAEPLRAFLTELAPRLRIEPPATRALTSSMKKCAVSFCRLKMALTGASWTSEASLRAFEAAIFRTEDRRVPLSLITIKPAAHSGNLPCRRLGITEEDRRGDHVLLRLKPRAAH